MHSTDIVAYTYNADIYCPGCIAQMFTEPDTGDDEFPKPLFLDNVNDAEFDHCGNMNDPKFKDVCEQHIAHDEHGPDGCYRWRNIDVRGPDFMGHDITWSDLDGEGFSLEMRQIFSNVPSERASSPGRIRWRYTFTDKHYSATDNITWSRIVFTGDDFESSASVDEPAIVADLLGFLSLNDGDTDEEFFGGYTERQIAWRDERAETLSLVQYDQFEGEQRHAS